MSKRRPRSGSGSFFSDIFSGLDIGSAIGAVTEAVKHPCHICGENTLLPWSCSECRQFACKTHAFLNLALGECLCAKCLENAFTAYDMVVEQQETERVRTGRGGPGGRPPRGRRGRAAPPPLAYPWSELGIAPEDATVESLKVAFRAKVQSAHPDHPERGGSNQAFVQLKKAYDSALRILAGKPEPDEEG